MNATEVSRKVRMKKCPLGAAPQRAWVTSVTVVRWRRRGGHQPWGLNRESGGGALETVVMRLSRACSE